MANALYDLVRGEFPKALRDKIQADHPDHFEITDIGKIIGGRMGHGNLSTPLEQVILDVYFELFRAGLISFGLNLGNAQTTRFRLTEAGKLYLADSEQAPENPAGYLAGLSAIEALSTVARSYLDEALAVFVGGHHRAAAVLLGAVAETTVLDIRDAFLAKLAETGETPPSSLSKKDATAKQVYEGLDKVLRERKGQMPNELAEAFESHWYSFLNDIRLSRNASGHPQNISPVTRDDVRAGFLQLRSVARAAAGLKTWINGGFKKG